MIFHLPFNAPNPLINLTKLKYECRYCHSSIPNLLMDAAAQHIIVSLDKILYVYDPLFTDTKVNKICSETQT